MQNSKIYSVLLYFNRIEQNRLRKYIISPYFNKNEALIDLFERLIKQINKENGKELTKEVLWQKLYPNKAFDDVRYRKLCSDLLKLVEGFLAQENYQQNTINQATYLMEAVSKRGLDKLYQTCISTSNRLSKKHPYRSADYYHNQYKFEVIRYGLEFELQRTRKSNIEDIISNLDKFYLSEKLKLSCDILSRQAFISHDYQQLFFDEIIEHVRKYKYNDAPPVAIYFQAYLAQTDSENEQHYYKLKSLLNEFEDQFPKEESETLYNTLLNYCVKKINNGNSQFLEELFLVYQDLLRNEIIFTDEILTPVNFNNIVIIALRLNHFDWCEDFISKYKVKLPANSRNNVASFNFARLFFYKKEYDKVISLLNSVEYEDIFYNLTAKGLLLQTYYEMDEIEPLYSLLDSLRTYVNRHKEIPLNRRKNYLNLIRFLKKLTKIQPGDSKSLESIRKELTKTKGIAVNKGWLLEKIAELE